MKDGENATLRPLSPIQRMILALYRRIELAQYGFTLPFMESMFRVRGYRGLFAMGDNLTRTIKALEKRYGQLIANLILAWAGLWNGCRYCSIGHVYAVNLLHFRETGRLYPIAESEVPELQELTYPELMERLRHALVGEEFAEQLQVIERMFELFSGAQVISDDDRLLSKALTCWAWLNECTIPVTYDLETSDVPALLLKKDREPVLNRYKAARKAAALNKEKVETA
jgi:hypothetical protein